MIIHYLIFYRTAQEELRQLNNSSAVAGDITESPEIALDNFTDFATSVLNETRNNSDDLLSTPTCIYIHGGLVASLFLIAITRLVAKTFENFQTFLYYIFYIIISSRSICFYSVCVRASQKLHDFMFTGILHVRLEIIYHNFVIFYVNVVFDALNISIDTPN